MEEEEEEEEEEEGNAQDKSTYKENARFEGLPINDLIDRSLAFWVHHTAYILPQGRTAWWNPNPPTAAMGEEEELAEEEEEEEDEEKVAKGEKNIAGEIASLMRDSVN